MLLALHRVAHRLWRWKVPLLPWMIYAANRIVFSVVLPPSAQIGRGVLLGYKGLGIVIHRRAVIGDGVLIGPGVVVGGRGAHERVPQIGQGVEIGAGAKILGPVVIGDGARIGANAVVMIDVPAHGVAVGVPARVVRVGHGDALGAASSPPGK
jgi:serine O-acetyltransferase